MDSKHKQRRGKHLLNSLDTAVTENLIGFVLQHEQLQVIPSLNVIVAKSALNPKTAPRTAILSGAGSGHEPMEHGFTGMGGIAASVAGQVFASPSTGQVVEILRLLSKTCKEILVVVNNYTGDRLNFGIAVERVKAEGIKCRLFCFGDDVAFDSTKNRKTGKRGLAGGTFLNKCLGSLAAKGLSLDELYHAAEDLTSKIATMSVSLTSCDIPGSGESFQLREDEMEIGLGIHGESGIKRCQLMTSKETVKLMFDNILDDAKSGVGLGVKGNSSNRVALLINNIGGLSNFDMNVVVKDAVEECATRGLIVERLLVGSFVTSFSMNGISISMMLVDDEILKLLDDLTDTPIFPSRPEHQNFRKVNPNPIFDLKIDTSNYSRQKTEWIPVPGVSEESFRRILKAACISLIAAEEKLNELDKFGGDGDCGLTCKKGAEAVLKWLEEYPSSAPSFIDLASISSLEMGGTSGAIYSLLLTSVHSSLQEFMIDNSKEITLAFWTSAIPAAIDTVTRYSWAEPGDRTMLDTLYAVYQFLSDVSTKTLRTGDILTGVAEAAASGADKTSRMESKAGRSSYASSSVLDNQPDPGAVGVAIWIRAIVDCLLQEER